MPKRTLKDRYKEALLARGAEVVGSTGRYLKLSRPMGGYYFLGTSGALRYGPSVASSRPVREQFKAVLLHNVPLVTKAVGPSLFGFEVRQTPAEE